jgi:hypothetical protein
MSARVQLKGLDELRNALRRLPQALTQEAHAIVVAQAEAAQREVINGYPEGPTGNLRRRVTIEVNTSKFSAGARVRSRAPHATIFERGTKARMTRAGASRGVMPQAPEPARMIPKAITHRRRMYQSLQAMLERHGLLVTGEA